MFESISFCQSSRRPVERTSGDIGQTRDPLTFLLRCCALAVAALCAGVPAFAAGTLTPIGSPHQPVRILDHRVDVVINNGFSRTEVTQVFYNPNSVDLEARYAFPIPLEASLAEFEMLSTGQRMTGEVIEKQKAEVVYEEQKARGEDAGLAQQVEQQRFEFLVSPVRANDETEIRFVYYQPLEIDTGVGRYVYPLRDGGTDERQRSFWTAEEQVQGDLQVHVELQSGWPVEAVRLPQHEEFSLIEQKSQGHWVVQMNEPNAKLDRDFVLYYRLAADLPGRVELFPYRAERDGPGTFLLVITPGVDLGRIETGMDYTFVLDISGSMQGPKIADLANALEESIGRLRPDDRFRLVVFNDRARSLHRGWLSATPADVSTGLRLARELRAHGGTNLYAGLELGLQDLDADRPNNVILVTDANANVGVVDPAAFFALARSVDVRFFGFVLGNGGNWPLMNILADSTGGIAKGVSSEDDLAGQIQLAASKVTHEALHGVELEIDGVDAWGWTGDLTEKIYHGQQLVLFGRYDRPGIGRVRLALRQTGVDREFSTSFDFPELDERFPEIERLWALARIDELERQLSVGLVPAGEAETLLLDLALDAQLVTERTSMVVLRDEVFEEYGIDRRNQKRTDRERRARAAREQALLAGEAHHGQHDQAQPMFDAPAASVHGGGGNSGGGSGAFEPVALGAVLLLLIATRLGRRSSSV